jgi:hypothetical protein
VSTVARYGHHVGGAALRHEQELAQRASKPRRDVLTVVRVGGGRRGVPQVGHAERLGAQPFRYLVDVDAAVGMVARL